jgi:hypothetical protein
MHSKPLSYPSHWAKCDFQAWPEQADHIVRTQTIYPSFLQKNPESFSPRWRQILNYGVRKSVRPIIQACKENDFGAHLLRGSRTIINIGLAGRMGDNYTERD